MKEWRPLRVICIGLQDTVDRVVTANLQCWGHEVVVYPAMPKVEAGRERTDRADILEGDILLYDLDASLDLVRSKEDTTLFRCSGFTTDHKQNTDGQWVRAPLVIALSNYSVARRTLEQIGAVALLQKPFAMGHLQRYLRVLQRLLFAENRIQCSDAQKKMRVLVVDDDAELAHAVRQCLLYESQYEVAVAYDGLEALERWLDWHPECIVTDLIMPRMNGYQVMRCLAIGAQHMMPGLVVMSALTPLEEVEDRSYLTEKAVAYVDKPFHVEHLLSAIKQVCAE